MTLNKKMSGLGGLRKAGWQKAGALAVFAVAVAWGEGSAQIVKAPRYQGGEGSTVNAPVPVLNLPPLPPAKTPNGTVVEDVVARINDQIISRSDVERAAQNLQQEAAQQNLSPSELTTKEKDMLRDMIDQQLLLSKAKELGLNADADVIRRLDEIRKQYKMSSMDDLEKAARQQGINFEDFKAQIRDQTLTQQVVRDEVGRHLQMTQADEVKFYDEHKKEFDQPEQVQLSEILVPLPENATPAEIVQAERKANELKSQLMQGADFAALAKKSSGGPTAAQGGELGLFKRGALAKVLEDQTFDLKAGETTQPIRTRQGFVILKVTEHVPAGPAPLKQVEPQVQEAMYMQEMQPALRAYLTKLREQAYIDIQPGFVDSGASPNQSKPVFTAYAPPVVKEKKVRDKSRFERTSANGRLSGAKKTVVASPDTTGTRTLTGAEAAPAIDPKTGLAVLPAETKPVKLAANGKQPRVKKEKVRFGQAPRNALSGGTEEASAPAETAPAAGSPGAAPENVVAASSANPDVNPLDPVAAPRVKTRFAARAEEHKEKKVATLSAKQQEKIAAKPVAMSTDEKATAATQAAPLGLNGDTAPKKKTKTKKEKKVKGQKQPKQQKTRLEDKKKAEPVQAAPVAPTASPLLAPTTDTGTGREKTPVTQSPVPNSTAPPTSTPGTSVPPTTLPAPGAPQQEPH